MPFLCINLFQQHKTAFLMCDISSTASERLDFRSMITATKYQELVHHVGNSKNFARLNADFLL